MRGLLLRWLKPEIDQLISERLLDFYDALREREQIPPPVSDTPMLYELSSLYVPRLPQ